MTVTGGTIPGYVFGAVTQGTGEVSANTVTINGGSIPDEVYGGLSEGGHATRNTATINGGRITGDIYGGKSNGNGLANNNTVTIGADAELDSGKSIYGGQSVTGGDAFTGNTFNIAGRHQVSTIYNFEHLNFTLPAGTTDGGVAVTAGGVHLGGEATVGRIDTDWGNTPLSAGTNVTLLEASSSWTGTIGNPTAYGGQGMSLLYEWAIDTTDINANAPSTLKATLRSVSLNPQTHALLSGRAAQTALLNQGADLIAGRGMMSLKQSAAAGNRSFMAVQGGSSRYKTGSGIDIDSFSMMAGAAWGTKLNADTQVALGAFVETGTGSYNSSNSFSSLPSVRGSGDTDFIGIGILGSLEWTNGFYADASLRGGRVKSDLSTSFIHNGQNASYDDTSSLYLGAHLGVGYRWALSKADTLDMYTRYLWSYTDSDSVKVLGDKYHFDSANSHRWRTGLKFGHTVGPLTPYAGVAYEFEFDGKAGGSVHGHNLKETDMGGSTFIGEVGLRWVPSDNENVSLDLALEGFAGERDGFMGNVRFNYRF